MQLFTSEVESRLVPETPWERLCVRKLKANTQARVFRVDGEQIVIPLTKAEVAKPEEIQATPIHPVTLKQASDDAQAAAIKTALVATSGHKANAASILGISRKSLWEKMVQFELDKEF